MVNKKDMSEKIKGVSPKSVRALPAHIIGSGWREL